MADGNEESENFFRLVRLIVDVGSKVLRDVLVHIIKPDTIDTVLQANVQTINRLYHGRPKILFDNEFTLLTETPPNPEKFDITLLVKICRNICPAICPHLIPPNYDWSPQSSPGQNDISLADDIYRMREYRNSIFAHISNTTVPYVKFLDLWTEIKAVVCRMSIHGSPGLKQDIDNTIYKLQTENVNPSSLKGLLVELRAWHEQDGKEHQDILKELKQTVCNCFNMQYIL